MGFEEFTDEVIDVISDDKGDTFRKCCRAMDSLLDWLMELSVAASCRAEDTRQEVFRKQSSTPPPSLARFLSSGCGCPPGATGLSDVHVSCGSFTQALVLVGFMGKTKWFVVRDDSGAAPGDVQAA
ncbi:hypothetical protein ACFQV4_02950 [Streptomyces thermocarboxydus]